MLALSGGAAPTMRRTAVKNLSARPGFVRRGLGLWSFGRGAARCNVARKSTLAESDIVEVLKTN
jgi:hypothetical protein